MDRIWTFIGTMTWRDWIAVIGLIVLPLSALNAFFGLRARYKDWQGTKNKKNFDKRLEQLKAELVQIENYKHNLPAFFLHIMTKAIPLFALCFVSLFLFMGAFAIYRIPLAGFRVFEFLYLGVGLLLMGYALARWRKLTRLTEIVNSPKDFGIELLNLIYTGGQKGFIVGEEDFIRSLINKKIFTDDERVQLFSHSFDLDRSSVNDYGTKPVHRDNGA
jgi:hypothetical protein